MGSRESGIEMSNCQHPCVDQYVALVIGVPTSTN